MWFKQAQLFELNSPLKYNAVELEELLEPFSFKPCLPSLSYGLGWVSPIDKEGAPLVHSANGYSMLCLQFEEKILPSVVVRQELNAKVKQMEAAQDRKVGQKEKRELKDEVAQSLLPRAFSKLSRMYLYFDTNNNWLVVDTLTNFKIEKFIELAKKSIKGLDFHAIQTKKISPILTNWVINGDCPKSFFIEQSCELRDPNRQGRVIRCQQQDLFANGIQYLLNDGCQVNQLCLNWNNRLQLTIMDDFAIKSIRYDDQVLEQAKNYYSETEEARFDADFFIMTQTFQDLFQDLIPIFEKD